MSAGLVAGLVHHFRGERGEALAMYDRALAGPGAPAASTRLGAPDRPVLASHPPPSLESLLTEGGQALQEARWADALAAFEAALAIDGIVIARDWSRLRFEMLVVRLP